VVPREPRPAQLQCRAGDPSGKHGTKHTKSHKCTGDLSMGDAHMAAMSLSLVAWTGGQGLGSKTLHLCSNYVRMLPQGDPEAPVAEHGPHPVVIVRLQCHHSLARATHARCGY
jgi:hypothetical protein